MAKREILPPTYKYVSAFLTFRCSLNCSYCLNAFEDGFNRKGFNEISGKEWIKGLNCIESDFGVPVTISGGEPGVHQDFIEIINGLKPELDIDILTNLYWSEKVLNKFLKEVNPNRFSRNSPYPSIRASYHPEQMKDGERLIRTAKLLKDSGFNIGVYAVQYPSPEQLESITQMQFRCLKEDIEFRVKDFTGKYEGVDDNGGKFSITYGDYSRYSDCSFQEKTKKVMCKTSELLIGTDGSFYRCHRDLYSRENSIGNILDPEFEIEDKFRFCDKYGKCHPCDVKMKTNNKQEPNHTSVEIKLIE